MMECNGDGVAGAVFGAVFGFGAGLVNQCVKVIVAEVRGKEASFSWKGVGVSTVAGLVKGATSPF